MYIGEIFRYSRPYNPKPKTIDGLPNYFHKTYTPGDTLPLLDAGISAIRSVVALEDKRCPAILISSSPHKIGSYETPWQDFFDPDNGHIRFYGDNKEPGKDPTHSPGNKELLEQFELQRTLDKKKRLNACPIIFFKRVRIGNRQKGNVQFQGFGLIERVERITQFDPKNQRPFSNYVFDFVVFSLTSENEQFAWNWISSRRDGKLNDRQTLEYAPESWKRWVSEGGNTFEKYRRRVVKLLSIKKQEQIPRKGSRESKALNKIYSFYSDKKKNDRFESLASLVVARIVRADGHSFREGWITPKTSDHGIDFIGRLDIGTGLAKVKIILLGQAKCEKLDTPTGGNHIARTVSRLRRGYIGAYVTTSYFSEKVQRQILKDQFPLILVNGNRVAEEVLTIVYEDGYTDVKSFLLDIDSKHDSKIMQREPEEILFL